MKPLIYLSEKVQYGICVLGAQFELIEAPQEHIMVSGEKEVHWGRGAANSFEGFSF